MQDLEVMLAELHEAENKCRQALPKARTRKRKRA
jgi:hypothetical protein